MEVLSIASYILVAHYGSQGSFLAGINYLLISSMGLILFLFGISVLYRYSLGTLNMLDISEKIPEFFRIAPGVYLDIGFIYRWVRNKMCNGAAPHLASRRPFHRAFSVSALICSIVIKVSIYAFFRTVSDVQALSLQGLYMFLVYRSNYSDFGALSSWPARLEAFVGVFRY